MIIVVLALLVMALFTVVMSVSGSPTLAGLFALFIMVAGGVAAAAHLGLF
jgi:hypothetical protein